MRYTHGLHFMGYLVAAAMFLFVTALNVNASKDVKTGVQTQVECNDNIFLDPSEETSDVIYRISPWLDFKRVSQRFQSSIGYHPSFILYHSNSENNFVGHRFDLGAGGQLTRNFDLFFSGYFDRREEGEGDDDTLSNATRLPYTTTAGDLTGSFDVGVGESLGFLMRSQVNEYDSESPSQDGGDAEGRVNARKKLIGRTFGTLDSGYLEGWYDDDTRYQLVDGTAGFEYTLSPKKNVFGRLVFSDYSGDSRTHYLTLNPYIGMAQQLRSGHYDLGIGMLLRDEEGVDTVYNFSLVGNADFRKSWRRGEVSVAFSTGHDEEYIDSDNPGFDTFLSGILSGWYGISKRWKGSGSLELREDSYLDNRPGESDRNDVTFGFSAGVERPISDWGTLHVEYAHNKRWSNMDENDYRENSIVMTVNCFTK